MELVDGDEELVALGVVQLQVLPLVALDGLAGHADEAGDAVLDVHHVVAGLQLGEEGPAVDATAGRRPPLLGEAEDLA